MDLVVLLNTVNLTSGAGFLLARAAGCTVRRRDRFWEATGYSWSQPRAAAFTVGCVVLSRRPVSEVVWQHEQAHVRQYAVLGPAFWPAYALAAGWSWLRTGDWWSRNAFRAGSGADGRWLRRTARQALREEIARRRACRWPCKRLTTTGSSASAAGSSSRPLSTW